MTGGQSYTFRWQFTAMHATTDFKYYVTRQGWNQNHNLARSDLDTTPFLTVPYNGQRPPATLSHSGTLPSGLSGHHVIVAVWTIADTAQRVLRLLGRHVLIPAGQGACAGRLGPGARTRTLSLT